MPGRPAAPCRSGAKGSHPMSDQGLDVVGHLRPLLGPERLERLGGVLLLQVLVVGVGELSGLPVELDLLERQQRHALWASPPAPPARPPDRADGGGPSSGRSTSQSASIPTSAAATASASISPRPRPARAGAAPSPPGDAGAGVRPRPRRRALDAQAAAPRSAPPASATATRRREITATSAPPATRIAEPGQQIAPEVEALRLRRHQRLLAVLRDERVEDLLRRLPRPVQLHDLAVQLGRVGAGEVGGAAGEDVEGAAAAAGEPLLDRLDPLVVVRDLGRRARAARRRRGRAACRRSPWPASGSCACWSGSSAAAPSRPRNAAPGTGRSFGRTPRSGERRLVRPAAPAAAPRASRRRRATS